MGMAISVQHYLESHNLPYETETHQHTSCSHATARAGQVPAEMLAKGVLIRRKDGFLLAVVPASAHVSLEEVGLATEAELAALFSDCEPGCIPPIGVAYGLQALLDEDLGTLSDVYFEAGDHCTLVHLAGRDFQRAMADARYAHIAASNH
jgi:Ala-tRNA(Pro) deacylase